MGVRDRLRNKLKSALDSNRTGPSPAANAKPLATQQTNDVSPQPATEELQTHSPPTTPTPTPTPTPAEPQLHPISTQADAIRADAPVRNSHLRPSFSSSGGAYTIRIVDERVGLDEIFPCEPDEFVLEAADRAGIELPYSCRSGGCLACTGRLLDGETKMSEQFVLEENHLNAGFRLLCCTTIQSNAIFVAHQEEEIG
jgi:ferredoxin